MKSFTVITLIASLVSSTFAQTNGQYTIDPNSVSNTTRAGWCSHQTAQCPLICSQTNAGNSATESNNCDPSTLTYSCVCTNGLSPNLTQYSQTLPYYICQEWGQQCVSNCNGDNQCQAACIQNHPCGAQDPRRVNITTTTSSMAATAGSATGSSSFQTGFASASGGGSSSPSSTAKSAASALTVQAVNSFGHAFGGIVVFSGMLLGFAVML